MSTATITREDLDDALRAHAGEAALQKALDTAATGERLFQMLGRYVQFNSAFGPGVANLAGEIGARPGLFQDRDEPVLFAADRAAHVASDFFYAAVDEFDDRADALARHPPDARPGDPQGHRRSTSGSTPSG